MAMETFGRMGEDMHIHLAALAEMATTRDLERGYPKVRWLHKWVSALSVGIARCVADCIDAAVESVEGVF